MKQLIKLALMAVISIVIIFNAISFTNKAFAAPVGEVQYVQCVVVDNKVQSCTDITNGLVDYNTVKVINDGLAKR